MSDYTKERERLGELYWDSHNRILKLEDELKDERKLKKLISRKIRDLDDKFQLKFNFA